MRIRIAHEKLSAYLSDDTVKNRHILIQRFTDLHQKIQCNADKQAAQAVDDLLEGTENV